MATKKQTKAAAKGPETLDLWNKVCVTDPAFTTPVKYGARRFTAINAQWQKWIATELWGPYGGAWGLKDLDYGFVIQTFQGGASNPCGVTLQAVFFWPDGEFEIATDIPYKPDDDCFKKLRTDALTKALSDLGFSADVFLGAFDDNRYVDEHAARAYYEHRLRVTGGVAPPPPPPEEPPPEPIDPAIKETTPFIEGTFTLVGLEGAVVGRLFREEKPLLKGFMPGEKSTKAARQNITDLVHQKITDTQVGEGLEEIPAEVAEEFYQMVLRHIADAIAARDS